MADNAKHEADNNSANVVIKYIMYAIVFREAKIFFCWYSYVLKPQNTLIVYTWSVDNSVLLMLRLWILKRK